MLLNYWYSNGSIEDFDVDNFVGQDFSLYIYAEVKEYAEEYKVQNIEKNLQYLTNICIKFVDKYDWLIQYSGANYSSLNKRHWILRVRYPY